MVISFLLFLKGWLFCLYSVNFVVKFVINEDMFQYDWITGAWAGGSIADVSSTEGI